MSKERARRREERQREAAVLTAARAAEAERRERRDARVRAMTSRLPARRTRPTGILAARRRRQWQWLLAGLLVANVAVWVFVPEWSARLGALVVSVLAAPVLFTLLFRR
ncbi:hypothetical protein GGQ22_11090 [Nocardioides sp. zg-579]|uniref:DUF3040 domain-containing protein n=1 Tax=Nocardioides marmotae TaxID=2663857 RepID=A0A6I3JBV1_9ACTN|nr:hypothetical protein [Nocardioides marmotae]MCR6031991.1 hypothetical protein [Gordonia jinghuaiqii]MTB95632.1 hypothetical protein [Nocardioides marmotae]QKE01048.1 hypothetical protein HPC71_08150 [Nocardioides marmotae]